MTVQEVYELDDSTGSRHEAETSLIHKSPVAKDADTNSRERDPFSKWKTTVCLGAILATLVLSTNIALLVWATSSFVNNDGIATIFEGNTITLYRRAE